MQPDPTTLAYLAGVIDSDGYATVHKSTRNGVAYYAARIGIAGTRRQPHDLAASLWGGTVGEYQPRNLRHRLQYQWSRSGAAAYAAIMDLLPHLRVKTEQAVLAIEVQENVWEGGGDDPFPWFGPEYDPTAWRDDRRDEVVRVLNQDRHATTRRQDQQHAVAS